MSRKVRVIVCSVFMITGMFSAQVQQAAEEHDMTFSLNSAGLIGFSLLVAGPAEAADHAAKIEILVPGSVIQAIEGIDIGPDGMICGTSIHA